MIFYRLLHNSTLHSFGDAISDVSVLGKKLSKLQEECIRNNGGELTVVTNTNELPENGGYFLFDENVCFTNSFIKSVIDIAKNENKNLQFCLARNSFNERYVLPTQLDNEEFHVLNFFYHAGGNEYSKVSVEQNIFEYTTEMPNQIIDGRTYHMDQCDCFAMHIISPFHLLFANLAHNMIRAIEYQSKIPSLIRNRFGKSRGKWFFRALKRMNKIGKNCNIHPTALIEGSVIGDNVTVGAYSIVRLSYLENSSYVSDNVTVINSVLAPKTFIANSNYINSCLTFREVFLIHGPYQLSVFGENAACFAVINCDIRLDQKNIKIPTSEGVLDSDQPLLGIAYGHRSKTGGGNIIAAGRIVPNDLQINPPDNIILYFDKK